ncbi:MAG: hypothetical protein SNJ70_08135 [Armatimonadota bacterium]
MEKDFREKPLKQRLGGGLKDMPQCENCGRPVKLTEINYIDGEVLCSSCYAEFKTFESAA